MPRQQEEDIMALEIVKYSWRKCWLRLVLVCAVGVVSFGALGQAAAPDGKVDDITIAAVAEMKSLYKIGATTVYKIAVPRRGFVGAPNNDAVDLLVIRTAIAGDRKPTQPEGFRTYFFRVTVIDIRKIKGGVRNVLRIDGVDKNGKVLPDMSHDNDNDDEDPDGADIAVDIDPNAEDGKGLYYACVDVLPSGTRLFWGESDDDESASASDGFVRHEMPFAFILAVPPALGPNARVSHGYMYHRRGAGVAYRDVSSVVEIEAVRLGKVRSPKGLTDTTWHKEDIEDILKDKKTEIRYREKQKWKGHDAWLWDEMERFDAEGNILMRCSKVK
jgi:hypothetical protein